MKNFIRARGKLAGILTLAALFLAAMLPAPATAQTFTTLHNFAGYPSDGRNPAAGLILSGNTLYGTASVGGSSDWGTVFAVNTNGTGFTNLYSFTGDWDGGWPVAGLILSGNNLYGTASANAFASSAGYGTVFAINTNGTGFTILCSFADDGNGSSPDAGLILSGNTLYGTTRDAGPDGAGTVFAVNTNGTGFTILHGFCACDGAGFTTTNSAGVAPVAGLILSGNTLYGTTQNGGSADEGTVFAVNTNGTGFTTLHSFTAGSDGGEPYAGLILSSNTLYGTISGASPGEPPSGNPGYGAVFAVNTDGTGFTTLHSFTALSQPSSGFGTNSDGAYPYAGLILSGNTLYGTASEGGSAGYGTVFAVNTDGTGFTTLHNFTGGSDGANPYAGLILSGNTLYGTTYGGGTNGRGTVFALTLSPSQPFINNIVLNTNNTVTISCLGSAGFDYLMVAATNLAPPISWQIISTNRADTNGTWQFTDYTPTNTVYVCFTNLVYTNSVSPPDIGNTNPPTIVGTNIWCGYLPATPTRFYRAATMP